VYEPPVAKRKKKEAAPPVECHGDGIVARYKRASFDYELGERFEAGMVLAGSEVKALRNGKADLTDGWVQVEHGEAYLHGVNIPELTGAAWGGHAAKRKRKLLLHRHEIAQLQRAIERQGMTVVATRLYFRGGRAKIEIALAKGKRKVDKRRSLKAREADREAQAAIDGARR
jgi:SsrA-binding protein